MTGGSLNVLAFDLSLTATGVADAGGSTTLTPPAIPKAACHDEQCARLVWLRDQIIRRVLTDRPDIVAVEGFSFASKGSSVDQVYGLGWTIRIGLRDLDVPYVLIPPSNVKKYATGKGTATKPDMRMALFQRFGLDLRDDNQVDAIWLYTMTLDHYGHAPVALPAAHRDALTKVSWPILELEQEAA